MGKKHFSGLQKKRIGKTVGRLLILITIVLTVFFGNLVVRGEEPEIPTPEPRATTANTPLSQLELKSNPFALIRNRVSPGTFLKINVNKKVFNEKLGKIENIYLKYTLSSKNKAEQTVPISSWYFEESFGELYLFVNIPTWDDLPMINEQSNWNGAVCPFDADIVIDYNKNGEKQSYLFSVELQGWKLVCALAFFLSTFVVLLLSFLMSRGIIESEPSKAGSSSTSKKRGNIQIRMRIKKMFLSQAGTQTGTQEETNSGTLTEIQKKSKSGTKSERISASKIQFFIWTVVVLFGIIYVYWMSDVILEITSQVLLLLGIGGGTAAGAKYLAVKKDEKNRSTTGDNSMADTKETSIHDFFKVQMLSFTIVIAVIVAFEIVRTNAFPVLSENLVLTMLISDLAYFGNKIREKK